MNSSLRLRCGLNLLIVFLVHAASLSVPPAQAAADAPLVHFDLRPVVAATPTDRPSNVRIELNISAMISATDEVPIDRWTLRVAPRQTSLFVSDYEPRTEAASDLAGPIEIKITSEDGSRFGLSSVAAYGPVHGDAGIDANQKTIHSRSFQELPPMRAITAAGTIRQGRGVFFKLRADGQRILEGEKQFSICFDVPDDWQGGLLDAEIVAEKKTRPLGSFEEDLRIVAEQHFVIAAYRCGNDAARRWANELFDAEQELRAAARRLRPAKVDSLPRMIHTVAAKIGDWSSAARTPPSSLAVTSHRGDDDWLRRLLNDRCDPYTDREISRLPVDLRMVALDYCDKRDEIERLSPKNPDDFGLGLADGATAETSFPPSAETR